MVFYFIPNKSGNFTIKISFISRISYFLIKIHTLLALINYKLILLLDSLSDSELDKFRKFISSPYHNNRRNYLPFLEKVIEFSNNPSENKNDENFRLKISDKKLSDQTLRNRYSELYKLGEEFLVDIWLSENKLEKNKILLKKLLEKNLYSPFRINFRETYNYAESKKFYNEKLKSLSELIEIHLTYLMNVKKEELLYNEYYEYTKIILCNNVINIIEMGFEFIQQEVNMRFYKPNYITEYLKTLNLDSIISEFRNSDNLMFRMTALYYYLYKANFDENNDEYYKISHKIFSEHFDQIEEDYKVKFFKIMINYCIRRFNEGNSHYKYELFKLYNEKLNQNLTEDLKINSYTFNHFRDFVFIGIAIKDFKWVENFIEKYSGLLPEELRDDEIKISYAKLDFEKKNFERSLSNLKKIKATHYLLYIDTSMYKLYNNYELGEFEESYLEIDKLKHYFSNNKIIPKSHSLNIQNFLMIYKKLLKFKTEPIKIEPGYLEKEIKGIKDISNKEWLLEKIAEFVN
jgi:hypothetical protein